MIKEITDKLYANDAYLNYLRYHPKWYMILDRYPEKYSDFEIDFQIAEFNDFPEVLTETYDAILLSNIFQFVLWMVCGLCSLIIPYPS